MSQRFSERFKNTLPWLMAEGALAMSYDTLIGPVYLSAWAGSVGLPADELHWIATLPWLGSVAQLFGVVALSPLASRISLKWLCIFLSLLSRSLWALAFLLPFMGTRQIGIIAAASSTIGLTGTSFWMAWMKGSVPHRFEGRFWGARARGSTLGILAAHALAAVILGGSAPHPFAWILVLALISATGSLAVLAMLPNARQDASPVAGTQALKPFQSKFSKQVRQALRDPADRRLIGTACLFHAGVQLAAPYFPYYFTRDVGLGAGEVSFWYGIAQLGIAVSALFWGRQWDRSFSGLGHDPSLLLKITGTVLALSPLPYMLDDASILRWIGPPEYFINGLAWAGFQVGLNTILFRSAGKTDPARATLLFALMTAAQGISSAAAAWAGGELAQVLAPWGGFRALWAVSAAFRLGIAWTFLPRLARR